MAPTVAPAVARPPTRAVATTAPASIHYTLLPRSGLTWGLRTHRQLNLTGPIDIVHGAVQLQRRAPLSQRGGLAVLLEPEEHARVTADADSAACRIKPWGPRPRRGAPPPPRDPEALRSAGSSSTLQQWQEVAYTDLHVHAALHGRPRPTLPTPHTPYGCRLT